MFQRGRATANQDSKMDSLSSGPGGLVSTIQRFLKQPTVFIVKPKNCKATSIIGTLASTKNRWLLKRNLSPFHVKNERIFDEFSTPLTVRKFPKKSLGSKPFYLKTLPDYVKDCQMSFFMADFAELLTCPIAIKSRVWPTLIAKLPEFCKTALSGFAFWGDESNFSLFERFLCKRLALDFPNFCSEIKISAPKKSSEKSTKITYPETISIGFSFLAKNV